MNPRTYLFTAMLFVPMILLAQMTPFLECTYSESYKDNLLNKENVRQDEMMLRISKTATEFFSLWNRERRSLQDSLLGKCASMSEILTAREKIKYPISTQHFVIYKNYPQKGMLTFVDEIFDNNYHYVDQLEIPVWDIKADKKKILEYNCQKAVTTFCGRVWNVWFTSEIPVQEGPWKLCGLPGLILQAEDSDGDYTFQCIAIRNVTGLPEIRVLKNNHIKCSKGKYIKELRESEEDTDAFLEKSGFPTVVAVGSNGKTSSVFKKKNTTI